MFIYSNFITYNRLELSIVIPCYNEEKRIISTLANIEYFCNLCRYEYEVIVVDDGSYDDSIKIITALFPDVKILENKKNMGKGYSVKKGLMHSVYDWVLVMDADGSTPIDYLTFLLAYSEYDIIIGSRKMKESVLPVKQSSLRVLMGNLFPLVVNFITKLKYNDTQCGFKLIKRSAIPKFIHYLTINRFAFDVELLYVCQLEKLKVKEVGVYWENTNGSKVRLFRDSIEMLKALFRIKWVHGDLKNEERIESNNINNCNNDIWIDRTNVNKPPKKLW